MERKHRRWLAAYGKENGWVYLAKTLFLLGCLMGSAAASGQDTLRLWATYYYVPQLAHDSTGMALLDAHEEPTGLALNGCDWCTAAIEGTVRVVKEGVPYLLTYAGRSDSLQHDCRLCDRLANYGGFAATGRVLWQPDSGYGRGVRNWPLVPYKTLAVDPAIIPYGSVVYIAEAVGVAYQKENGQWATHDGYFFAGDTGSAIQGNHIDVFLGTSSVSPFAFITSTASGTFVAQIVTDTEKIATLRALHGLSPTER